MPKVDSLIEKLVYFHLCLVEIHEDLKKKHIHIPLFYKDYLLGMAMDAMGYPPDDRGHYDSFYTELLLITPPNGDVPPAGSRLELYQLARQCPSVKYQQFIRFLDNELQLMRKEKPELFAGDDEEWGMY
ncbi:hypothetical protein CAP35_13140 [Chitinophagaceae bacterium IBVUCB1]|nr:hypothetical protein CAP35_13140 [Chitinophagaceae bacterium IBVUCB1]